MSKLVQPMSAEAFERPPLPKRFCNLDRVLHALKARNLDGIVVTSPQNIFYLSGFNAIAHKADEPRVCAVVLSRHAPEHPIMVIADYYLASFLTQETWIEDIRPFRAVMMALDLPVQKSDVDRFIPRGCLRCSVDRKRPQTLYVRNDGRSQRRTPGSKTRCSACRFR